MAFLRATIQVSKELQAACALYPCTWQEALRVGDGQEGEGGASRAPRLEGEVSALWPLSVTFVSLQTSEQIARRSGLAWSLDRLRPRKLFATFTLEGVALGLLVGSSRGPKRILPTPIHPFSRQDSTASCASPRYVSMEQLFMGLSGPQSLDLISCATPA